MTAIAFRLSLPVLQSSSLSGDSMLRAKKTDQEPPRLLEFQYNYFSFFIDAGSSGRTIRTFGAYSQVSQEYPLQRIRETEFMAVSRPKEHESGYRYSKVV